VEKNEATGLIQLINSENAILWQAVAAEQSQHLAVL
jgi:hypothetical protein